MNIVAGTVKIRRDIYFLKPGHMCELRFTGHVYSVVEALPVPRNFDFEPIMCRKAFGNGNEVSVGVLLLLLLLPLLFLLLRLPRGAHALEPGFKSKVTDLCDWWTLLW